MPKRTLHSPSPKALPDTHPELPIDPDIILPQIPRPAHLVSEFQATVFIGGCLGALSRYGVSLLFPDPSGAWPTATFAVNMAGAFVLGLLLEGLARRGQDVGLRRLLRLGIGTGFIGASTTYSTLAVDGDLLLKGNHVGLAMLYVFMSAAGGILLSAAGIQLAGAHHAQRVRRHA